MSESRFSNCAGFACLSSGMLKFRHTRILSLILPSRSKDVMSTFESCTGDILNETDV